jgi:UDP-N-acetylglucosamine 4,6-dehydratase
MRMTRFWITLDQGVRFVIRCIEQMHGGEVFVPKIPSMNIVDLAKAIAPDCRIEEIGIRPGEKVHEVLLSEDEARHSVELDKMFVIRPAHPWWANGNWAAGRALPDGFRYTSDGNPIWLSLDELRVMAGEEPLHAEAAVQV